MTGGLEQLLDEAVPEPPRRLDPAHVLRVARRRRRGWRASLAVGAAALAATGISVPSLWQDPTVRLQPAQVEPDRVQPTREPAQEPVRLSVLERRVPVDQVGAFFPSGPARTVDDDPLESAQLRLVHPGQASLVLTSPEGTRYYLAQSTDGLESTEEAEGSDGALSSDGVLCLAWVAPATGGTGSGCLPGSTLLTTGFVMPVNSLMGGDGSDVLAGVVVIVPDGYEEVSAGDVSVDVRDNAALVPVADDELPQRLTLSGRGVPEVVLPGPYCPSPGVGMLDQCPDDVRRPPSAPVAQWRLAEAPRPEDTSLSLLVNETTCASGRSAEGRVQEPAVEYRPEGLTITVRVTQLGGAQSCPSNPDTPYTVQLEEPVGTRALLDGSIVPPVPVQLPDS
ncbi:hypothetical protein [Kineococcus terrestris]|uniref:hypothetical protein n=1 Tax=Kineococcus terrestris TaxID=2044856 RepID=UPI0034DB1CD4